MHKAIHKLSEVKVVFDHRPTLAELIELEEHVECENYQVFLEGFDRDGSGCVILRKREYSNAPE